MREPDQRGFSIIEAVVAAAVIAVGVGGLAGAMGTFARYAAHPEGARRGAAALLAEQTLRIAQDTYKYGAPDLPSDKTWQAHITLALPQATPVCVPVTVHSLVEPSAGAAAIEITVTYPPDTTRPHDLGIVRVRGDLAVLSTLPGSSTIRPGLVPDPAGP